MTSRYPTPPSHPILADWLQAWRLCAHPWLCLALQPRYPGARRQGVRR